MTAKRTQTKLPADHLRDGLSELRKALPTLSRAQAAKAITSLDEISKEIDQLMSELDPIRDPGPPFDPTVPSVGGKLVALALLSQDRAPLAKVARTYGAGVYAIYYAGDHPLYKALSKSETPIYVGKADPKSQDAKTAKEQGPQLYSRLSDHRRMILQVSEYASDNGLANGLDINHFEYRRLVCATNAQLVAERHLIDTFKPIWNSEMKVAFGISKHGDSAETRRNDRSPWDVLHPGRPWALKSEKDQYSLADIEENVRKHILKHPPFADKKSVLDRMLKSFVQPVGTAVEEQHSAGARPAGSVITGVASKDD